MGQRRIGADDGLLLQAFLDGAGDALRSFRYFAKRTPDVLRQHACTWLWMEGEEPVAYGHLDREGDVVWLGIAVQERHWGHGHGARMMRLLLDSAQGMGITALRLSVDADNHTAIRLYERYGFVHAGTGEGILFLTCDLMPKREAVMSSLAFAGLTPEAMIAEADREFMALEFSSGMPFHPDMEELFRTAPMRRFAHNYFPAPAEPFVLNLGSADDSIRDRSIAHCVRGMQLSHAVGAPFFSVHAGFCVDPRPSELGRRLEQVAHIDRALHWARFTEAVRQVLARTRDLPTGLLIENNVLAPVNRYADGTNPLLNVEAGEQLRLLDDVPDARLGLLLDTAHLKVSARTLGSDAAEAAGLLLPQVRCVHHSDNGGEVDDNQGFGADYWFLPLMDRAGHAVHVLETRKTPPSELRRMERLLFPERAPTDR
ncbi:MAG: GNAT family N-acetyltransferase [Flavobacteriales bacterium]|nr:GNAT family N-acetyltransferase [Flavobacteriales bacterium]MBK7940357.1 GNAT family N-acetyltransferase [Flavobacteriales bacterium]MBK8950078.1 GNAT family N-acetyltransferase [Flavobacteriales bacterium]